MRRTAGHRQMGRVARYVPAVLAMAVLSGCLHEDEAALRDRLDRWFSISETVAFHATRNCVAGAFRLVQTQVKSPLSVVNSASDVPRELSRRGAVALDNPDQAPDDAMIEIATAAKEGTEFKDAPHTMPVRRLDDVKAARQLDLAYRPEE